MKNRDYIEGFIEGVSMCWNNGMKVCPEYTAIYIDTFFIDNDKNNDLNEIIKKKLLQYYENISFDKKNVLHSSIVPFYLLYFLNFQLFPQQ